MAKKIILIVVLLVIASGTAYAEKSIKVGVLPFSIYSEEDLRYLSQGILDMLNTQFRQKGVGVVVKSDVIKLVGTSELGRLPEERARQIGRSLGTDYIIQGSLTKIGTSLSIDVIIVDTTGAKKPASVFVQGKDLKALKSIISELVLKSLVKIGGTDKVDKIIITGNQRIEGDAIRAILKSREGDPYSKKKLSADIKSIYAMKYFKDVTVEVRDSDQGKIINFKVDEKASIAEITFSGNLNLKDEELLEDLGYKTFAIFDARRVLTSVEKIKELYRQDGYYNAEVTYEVKELSPKRVGIKYKIDEKGRVYIEGIQFIGNKDIPGKKLLKLMETSERGLLSWFTNSGILNRDELKQDVIKVMSYYHNLGYIKVQIGDPVIKVEKDKITISITVNEGPQYRVGNVEFSGDLIKTKEELIKATMLKPDQVFNRDIVRKDLEALQMIYNSNGYAYAIVNPGLRENNELLTIDIIYNISKKGLVYFEWIEIEGNTKTREKVIRRELKINEGDLFSDKNLRLSMMNLYRLGYFEDVNISQSVGSDASKMNIKFKVKEQSTGAFAVGAGYSSYNKIFGTASISQNNLFGRGQKLKLETSFGARVTEYTLGFTEPWLFGIPLTAGFEVYNQSHSYADYDKYSNGGTVGVGYRLVDYVKVSGRYKYEQAKIGNVNVEAYDNPEGISGGIVTSSLSFMLKRDTKNRRFSPSAGSENSFLVEFAGGVLSGDASYTKYIVDSGWFFGLPWWKHVFFIRGRAGYVAENTKGGLPLYERFYLGGINSLRGFGFGAGGPIDKNTGTIIGGNRMVQINVEYIFPISKEAGLDGVLFFDAGYSFSEFEDVDVSKLRQSVGAGIRFYSPVGPMRLEYGYVLKPRAGEKRSTWEFTIGTFF